MFTKKISLRVENELFEKFISAMHYIDQASGNNDKRSASDCLRFMISTFLDYAEKVKKKH